MSAVFDLHCDTPHNIASGKFNHIRPRGLYRQGYIGAVFAHFVYPKSKHPFVDAVTLVTSTSKYVNNSDRMRLCKEYRERETGSVNIILGVEGGHIFDTLFSQVEALLGLGIRIFTYVLQKRACKYFNNVPMIVNCGKNFYTRAVSDIPVKCTPSPQFVRIPSAG